MTIEINPGSIAVIVLSIVFGFIFGLAKKQDHKKNLVFFKLVWEKGFTAVNEQHNFVKPKLFRGPPTDIMPDNAFSFLKKRRGVITFLSQKRNVKIFNYSYTTRSGRNNHTYHYFCFLFTAEKDLPAVEIRSENFIDKVLSPIYSKDIPIPANTEWSKKYLVSGGDEQTVQNLITPFFIEHFQSSKYSFFTSGNQFLLIYDKRQSHNIDEQLNMIEDGLAICKIFEK